jgi:hypothetical protein
VFSVSIFLEAEWNAELVHLELSAMGGTVELNVQNTATATPVLQV